MTEEIYYRQLDALSKDIKHSKINKVLEKPLYTELVVYEIEHEFSIEERLILH